MIVHQLGDYTCDPKVKHLANTVNEVIDNFYKSLQIKAFDNIYSLIDTYENTLDECQKEFIEIMNERNDKKVSSIYVRSFDGVCIDDYIQNRFNFTISKKNYKINYTYEKFYEIFLYEVGLLFAKHEVVYDFMIKFAQLKLLLNRFQYYTKDTYNNTYCINFTKNEMDHMYNNVMYLDFNQLPLLEKTQKHLIDNLIKGPEKIKGRKSKPTCPEDLEDLFEDWMIQKDKVQVVAEYYNCSELTARRYMTKFGCYEARATKKDVENIRKDIKETSEEMIYINKQYFEAILKELKELREEIKALREEKQKDNIFVGINSLGSIDL